MSQAPKPANPAAEARRLQYLRAMGVDIWVGRTAVSEPASASAIEPVTESATRSTIGAPSESAPLIKAPLTDVPTLERLRQQVAACQACPLHESRTQTVFGVGPESADWLFVGEAPGAEEDKQGEPFVGRAGKLLNAMLFALGLHREQVFIANVLKCRPPNNRDPRPDEVQSCEKFLQQQIHLLQPRIIVALGRHAAHSLLKTDEPLARLRGKLHSYQNTPLIVTYHPAYLLRSPAEKAKAWSDLCLAQKQVVES